jgi:hypothetical protein
MDTNEMIEAIVAIPYKFHKLGNISTFALLKETGYFQNYEEVTESRILEALVKHPEHVSHWQGLSDDNRASSGWYFTEDNKRYLVGSFPRKEGEEPMQFADPKEACAVFIKRDIERTRMNAIKYGKG